MNNETSHMMKQMVAYFCKTSITCGNNLSLDVAGILARLALASSSAALSMNSRKRDTSSSAKRSSTSSSASFLRFFGREAFFDFRMASICLSKRILFAMKMIDRQ
jgi:hypothetical protein